MGLFADTSFFDTLNITPEMLNLIAEIDEFKGEWKIGNRIATDRLLALKKIATIESIGSSTRIEGAKLQDSEVETLLLSADTKSFQTRDEQEVAGYAYVCDQIYENCESIPLTENSIKQLHSRLLQYCDKDEKHRGKYKTIPIRIEAFDAKGKSVGILFETTSPLETPLKMQELVLWTNEAFRDKTIHPLIIIGVFIVLFLAIHPFKDGNGRLARLLTTLLMLKSGYFYVPYSSLESIIEASKDAYYIALQKTQKSWQKNKPDWNTWLLFLLRAFNRQKKHLEIKIVNENNLLKIPSLQLQILSVLKSHGRLQISQIATLTNANRNTLKKTLETMVKQNSIVKGGVGKATWYTPHSSK